MLFFGQTIFHSQKHSNKLFCCLELVIFFHLIGNMGRTKSKEKFRQGKKKKLYSKQIQGKMRELKQQGKSREKICEILKVPLVDERSFYRYVNPKNEIDEQGSATCTFNRAFNYIVYPR